MVSERHPDGARPVELVYHLSGEEHAPDELVRHAALAEEHGFRHASISDHFHPWLPRQGHSPFVWSVLGAIATTTDRLRVLTAVTCPMIRTHPAIVAHAAATTADLFDGRFTLGVGSGEYLNEHVLGDRWPSPDERLDMLEEAVEVMRDLFTGGKVTHRGTHYTVEDARLWSLPAEPAPIVMAAGGDRATALAGRIADGLISVRPDADQVARFTNGAGEDDARPRYGKQDVCYARDADMARETMLTWWSNAGMGPAGSDLRTPEQFEALRSSITPDAVVADAVLGPDPEPYRERIAAFRAAGFDHVILHQVGPDQEGFLEFAAKHLLDGG